MLEQRLVKHECLQNNNAVGELSDGVSGSRRKKRHYKHTSPQTVLNTLKACDMKVFGLFRVTA